MKYLILALLLPLCLRADPGDDRAIEAAARDSAALQHLVGRRVEVRCERGVATIVGDVATPDERLLAGDILGLIPNVRAIDNQIRVGARPTHSDGWVAMRIRLELMLHPAVSEAATHVAVQGGIVFLTGTARTPAQKELTARYAARVPGIRWIFDDLDAAGTLAAAPSLFSSRPSTFAGDTAVSAPAIPDGTVRTQVDYALLQHHLTAATHPRVTVRAGTVTLTGHAEDQDEKEQATAIAEQVRGVTAVDNFISVAGQ